LNFEKFLKRMMRFKTYYMRIKWIKSLKPGDYAYLQESYLVPGCLMSIARNEISLLHALAILARKRIYRGRIKEIHFPYQMKSIIVELAWLTQQFDKILDIKTKLYRDLKAIGFIRTLRDFLYLVNFLMLPSIFEEGKKAGVDFSRARYEFERQYRFCFIPDSSLDSIQIMINPPIKSGRVIVRE